MKVKVSWNGSDLFNILDILIESSGSRKLKKGKGIKRINDEVVSESIRILLEHFK